MNTDKIIIVGCGFQHVDMLAHRLMQRIEAYHPPVLVIVEDVRTPEMAMEQLMASASTLNFKAMMPQEQDPKPREPFYMGLKKYQRRRQ